MRMPLLSSCVALASLLLAACSQDAPPPPATDAERPVAQTSGSHLDIEAERAAVREVFLGYRNAIVAQRGEDAVRVTSVKTLDYYESMRVSALEMLEVEVRGASLMDKIMVLSFRARLTQAQLESSSGKDLFVMAVDRGWIGDDVGQSEPGEIRIDNDTARIGVRKGNVVLPSAAGLRAYREGSVWRLDVMSIRRVAEPALRAAVQKIDTDEDRAMVKMIEVLTDKKVGPEIWQPLRKRAKGK